MDYGFMIDYFTFQSIINMGIIMNQGGKKL